MFLMVTSVTPAVCAKIDCPIVDNLVISGNEEIVTARFSELLASGLDELMVTLLPIKDTGILTDKSGKYRSY